MRPITPFVSLLFGALLTSLSIAEEKKAPAISEQKESVTRSSSVTIDGKKIEYTVTTSEMPLRNADGEETAHIFHIAYTKKGVTDYSERPVLFAFNGGPGSSSIWLHLGALGPKIIPSSENGTAPLTPPITVKQNPYSILDVADLVFIDPVSTGLSRATDQEKEKNFHGVQKDLDSMANFLRLWVTKNKRWSSPKYILGESYGALRAAGLSEKVEQRYGMQLNGVILLSGLLDYRTISPSQGNDLAYISFLPSLTATAHFHEKIKGDRDSLVNEAKEWAASDYRSALHQGHTLDPQTKQTTAQKLSYFTGLPTDWIIKNHLRIPSFKFRKELLRDENKTLGRFDGRIAWESFDSSTEYPSYDPSYSVVYGPISTAMLDYLGTNLGWKDERVYEILTGKVHPWDWDATNEYVNLSESLANALKHNPKLRVLIQCGYTDLATPPSGILYSVDHMLLPQTLRKNISIAWYDAGHMFYLNQPDLIKMRKDLVDFITASKDPNTSSH
ncbi:S10 family peptidase [Rubritalea spongiae]|uniref:S10 family peptidase n=1 Tax=Rubritalea spongiae TaxID=430797 RepID=A0ABW5E881_9BACT